MPTRILRDWTDSDRLDALSAEGERMFVRLIMKADDFGRFHAEPRRLRAAVFPLRDDVTARNVVDWLAELTALGLVFCYETDGRALLSIPRFGQRLRVARSKFPPPPGLPADWTPDADKCPQPADKCPQPADKCPQPADKCPQSAAIRRNPPPDLDLDSDAEAEAETNTGAFALEGGSTPSNRRETKANPPAGASARPALAEWTLYGATLAPPYPEHECQSSFDHYTANGWKMGGKAPVKDWKACLRTCWRRWKGTAGANGHTPFGPSAPQEKDDCQRRLNVIFGRAADAPWTPQELAAYGDFPLAVSEDSMRRLENFYASRKDPRITEWVRPESLIGMLKKFSSVLDAARRYRVPSSL